MIILILITLGSLIRMYAIDVTNQVLTIASCISMLCALMITWKVGQYKYWEVDNEVNIISIAKLYYF